MRQISLVTGFFLDLLLSILAWPCCCLSEEVSLHWGGRIFKVVECYKQWANQWCFFFIMLRKKKKIIKKSHSMQSSYTMNVVSNMPCNIPYKANDLCDHYSVTLCFPNWFLKKYFWCDCSLFLGLIFRCCSGAQHLIVQLTQHLVFLSCDYQHKNF